MNQSILALVFFVSWIIFLAILIVGYRALQVVLGNKKSNEFPANMPHGPELYWRIYRAAANSMENLPIFATLVLAGNVVGMVDLYFTYACYVIVIARICQSIVHMISVSVIAVNIRFTFYITQIGGFIYLITKLF